MAAKQSFGLSRREVGGKCHQLVGLKLTRRLHLAKDVKGDGIDGSQCTRAAGSGYSDGELDPYNINRGTLRFRPFASRDRAKELA
jgi:hypothetical protein